jgi:hypothetical protein
MNEAVTPIMFAKSRPCVTLYCHDVLVITYFVAVIISLGSLRMPVSRSWVVVQINSTRDVVEVRGVTNESYSMHVSIIFTTRKLVIPHLLPMTIKQTKRNRCIGTTTFFLETT